MGQERDEKSGKFKSKGKRKVKKEVEEKTVDLENENENEEEIVPEIGFQILYGFSPPSEYTTVYAPLTNPSNDNECDIDNKQESIVSKPGPIINPALRSKCHDHIYCPEQDGIFEGAGLPNIPGRRLVDFGCLAEGLSGCKKPGCGLPLDLFWTSKEVRRGLASILTIVCKSCGHKNKVYTSKYHLGPPLVEPRRKVKKSNQQRRCSIPDVNTKAQLAELHAGTTRQVMENYMAEMGVPYLSCKTSRRRSIEVADVVYDTAIDSCKDVVAQEIRMSYAHNKLDTTGDTSLDFKSLTASSQSCSAALQLASPKRKRPRTEEPTKKQPMFSTPQRAQDNVSLSCPDQSTIQGCENSISDAAGFEELLDFLEESDEEEEVFSDEELAVPLPIDDSTHTEPLAPQTSTIEQESPTTPTNESEPSAASQSNTAGFLEEMSKRSAYEYNSTLIEALDLPTSKFYPTACNVDLNGCTFKYDMMWPKRSSGRRYDSMIGIGLMFGKYTHKIAYFGVKSKRCKMCEYHTKKGTPIPYHICIKNWDGSSKAMEPAVCLDGADFVEGLGAKFGAIVMDDDQTTIAHLRQHLKRDLPKLSDLAHSKKHVASAMYPAISNYKELCPQVIKALQSMFSSAVKQNKGNTEGLKAALENIPDHCYGIHTNCGSWCRGKTDEKYVHRLLPNGKDLTEEPLKCFIAGVFKVFADHAAAISPAESTSEVESANSIMSTKASKRINLGFAEQIRSRASCGTLQKNTSNYGYLGPVNKKLGMSPGKRLAEYGKKMNKLRAYWRNKRADPEQRRKKILAEYLASASGKAKEVREGFTYHSGIGLTANAECIQDTITAPIENPCDKTIVSTAESHQIVYFDLETTGRGADCDIIQMAAKSEQNEFNKYIYPQSCVITKQATKVHGISLMDGRLSVKGNQVPAISFSEGFKAFSAWLKTNKLPGKKILLAAHNAKSFDSRRLVKQAKRNDLQLDSDVVDGFLDTLQLCKKVLYPGLESYKLQTLVKDILKQSFDAHNALADVSVLKDLVDNKLDDPSTSLTPYTVSLSWLVRDFEIIAISSEHGRELSFQPLIPTYLKPGMAKKAAKSGLCLNDFVTAVSYKQKEGLRALLAEPVAKGKPRVTSARKTFETLWKYFEHSASTNVDVASARSASS